MNTARLMHMQSILSAPDEMPIVFIVDDDVSVRESLELLVRSAGWQPMPFSTAEDFLANPRRAVASCLVLDVSLPGLNGLDLQDRIARDYLHMPIIFITGFGNIPMSVRAMKRGAVEFLTKPVHDELLLRAIASALDRSRQEVAAQAELQELAGCHQLLSRRERQVMELVVAGRLNKQVAADLGISEITVKAHRGRMMRKMNARSLAHLVKMAARLTQPPRLDL